MGKLEQKAEENKTCAWFIIGKPYVPCPSCYRYNVNCPEYVPLIESGPESIVRIMKNLNKPELKRRRPYEAN